MKTKDVFRAGDRLGALIEENPQLILVMCRSGLSMGYADKTVGQVCKEDGAHCPTFLAICNLKSGKPYSEFEVELPALMRYLERTHKYFIDYMLPLIRRKLIASTDGSANHDVTYLLLKFFDDYVDEVRRHMDYENRTVFDYANSLMEGKPRPGVSIDDYLRGHTSMTRKLNELKDIFVRHYHQKCSDVLNSALLDIILCEQDLLTHCEIENRLFIPAVQRLEESMRAEAVGNEATAGQDPDRRVDDLSEREKEVIRGVARGKVNKEIADELNLSVHTVNTYRRNISAKLGIHSAAGLTIFALLNNLVSLTELSPRTARL